MTAGLTLWKAAGTLGDLRELTAAWLEGTIAEHPGYPGRPDEETAGLVPSLAAVNRAGFLTTDSQPGCTGTTAGETYQQRASVDGLISDTELLKALAVTSWGLGIQMIVHHGPGYDPEFVFPATLVDDRPVTWSGGRLGHADTACLFEGCHPDALRAVTSAWQVALVDPVVGRSMLWTVLDLVSGRAL